jgi:lactate permease
MFHQQLTPIAGSLGLSCLVAAIPVLTVLLLLGVLRRPAWQAASAGLLLALIIAVLPWRMPIALAVQSVLNGATFAMWPMMWIVINGLLLYNISVRSGRFDALRTWVLQHLPNDRRVVLVVMGFCFGAMLEAITGFGAPVAVTAALLILVGFPPLEAVVFVLIFNTAPVAFGALGNPITVLSAVTGLPAAAMGAMVGRQLPLIATILPLYVIALYGGWRSVRALWPVLLVAGASFGIAQFVTANYINYLLTDVFSSLSSLLVTLLFLRVWHPAPDPAFMINRAALTSEAAPSNVPAWQGWLPWLTLSIIVTLWIYFKVPLIWQRNISWPLLDKAISITLYNDKPYAAIWNFQPLATGTGILVSCLVTALLIRVPPAAFLHCLGQTLRQVWRPVIAVLLIVGLAYLMNYSGLAYTLGKGAAWTGRLFILFSPFLGWLAVLLSGSDASGNALFGNLQVVAARQLNLNPVLFAATNTSGGVMGKMISPQNITTGLAVTGLKGKEGAVFARTFIHSIILTIFLVVLVVVTQYLVPQIIPTAGGAP